jgi:hypothetical protein
VLEAGSVDRLPADLDEIEALYTTVAEGLRTFRVTPAKPEEAAA